MGEPNQPSGNAAARGISFVHFAIVFASLLALSLALYRPALSGPFISDDDTFIALNPYIAGSDFDLRGAVDPSGHVHALVGRNYMPVVHLLHALEWRLWGGDTTGYHVVNVVLHALNAALLVALLQGSGVARTLALLGGALFAVHPANVEAVAWISQSRSLLAVGFSLAALLLFRKHPLASVPLFALALLSKATAGYALVMAAAFTWLWRGRADGSPRRLLGVALWAAVFAAFTPVQMEVTATLPPGELRAYPDLSTHIRSICAIGAHYLVMAATGYGTAAFQEPEPVRSLLEPWWLAGLAAIPLFLWRIVSTWRARRDEAAWWLGAAAAFAPASQVLPFFFGIADRYLYFILPGLIGGALLAAQDLAARAMGPSAPRAVARLRPALRLACVIVAAGLLLRLGAHAHSRATLWQNEVYLLQDAASQYPNGMLSSYLHAVIAVEQGDLDAALAHLRTFDERGGTQVQPIYADPRLAALQDDPRFQEFLRELAGEEIAFRRARGELGQSDWIVLSYLHRVRGELDLELAAVETALRAGGPQEADLLELLENLRRARASAAQGLRSERAPDAPHP